MVHKLLYLNGLAILGVILFHTAGTGLTAMFSWGHRYLPESVPVLSQVGSLPYFELRLLEQVSIFAIPTFLFVSGFFVAITTGSRETIDWRPVLSRSRSLIIPYLIWLTLAIFLLVVQGRRFGVVEFIRMYLTGSANPVFYFVPLLVQFYLLAPFMVRLIRKNWKLFLLLAGLLQLAVQSLQYQMVLGADILVVSMLPIYIPKWFFLSRIFWFPLGIVAGFNSKLLVSWLERYRIWLFCLALVLIPLGMWEWELYYQWSGVQWLDHFETLTDGLYSLVVIFGVLSLDLKKLPFLAEIRLVGSMSYGIYLVHSLIIEYFARTIYHVLPQILGYQIVFQPLVIVAGLGVPLFLMFLVNRSVFRSGYTYLFG